MTTRRGFLGVILAAAAAPALVRASSLMPIYVPPAPRLLTLWGDGVHDDTAALQALIKGERVLDAWGALRVPGLLAGGSYLVSQTLVWGPQDRLSVINASFNGASIPKGMPVLEFKSGADCVLRDSYVRGAS